MDPTLRTSHATGKRYPTRPVLKPPQPSLSRHQEAKSRQAAQLASRIVRISSLAVSILASLQLACSHAPAPGPAAVPESQVVRFFVGATGGAMLEGVSVSLITADGREVALGKTDAFGTIDVSAQGLQERHAILVLFEKEWHFSAAVRVNDDLLRFGDYLVTLSPVAFR